MIRKNAVFSVCFFLIFSDETGSRIIHYVDRLKNLMSFEHCTEHHRSNYQRGREK